MYSIPRNGLMFCNYRYVQCFVGSIVDGRRWAARDWAGFVEVVECDVVVLISEVLPGDQVGDRIGVGLILEVPRTACIKE